MDLATFMRAPQIKSPSDCDIAMVGIPYDGAVTNRPGARQDHERYETAPV